MILVTGAGGFIGGHLVKRLLDEGERVLALDIKDVSSWHQVHDCENHGLMDLRNARSCEWPFENHTIKTVYNLAADMGGMGFIETHKAACMLSVLISTNMLVTANRAHTVERFFYSSSACVYAADKQTTTRNGGLVESDAYPAQPEDGYGWEKLFSERMCGHFLEDFGLETRIGRYHNVYGPLGTYEGGREKAPAAICRKVAQAALGGSKDIEIWGDGKQTRSFMYVDDCVEGTLRLTKSEASYPLNIGSSQLVTINELVDLVEEIADVKLHRTYKLDAPQGVRGRNSDNTLIQKTLGWQPRITLEEGMETTYKWIYDGVSKRS